MARIRTIKPDFWADESISNISFQARLLFIGTWNLADDYGILRAKPKWIKGQLFPYDDDLRIEQVSQWIEQLVKARMMIPFVIEDEGYLYIRTFSTHQKIDKPNKNGFITAEKLATAFNLPTVPGTFDEYSTNVRRAFAGGKERKGRGKEEEVVVDVRLQVVYEMLCNATSGYDNDFLIHQAKLILNKYPELIARKSGALINKWASMLTKDDEAKWVSANTLTKPVYSSTIPAELNQW